jgi:hypothetical protein
MSADHKFEQFLDEYLAAAGIRDDANTPSSARRPASWRKWAVSTPSVGARFEAPETISAQGRFEDVHRG